MTDKPPENSAAHHGVEETRRRLAKAAALVDERLRTLIRVDQRFMSARVLTFLLIVSGYFLTAFKNDARFGWFMMLPALAGFILIVRLHRPRRKRLERTRRLATLISAKSARLNTEMRPEPDPELITAAGTLVSGERNHAQQDLKPYTHLDLGIFNGRSNLFGLLWNGHTRLGALQLAAWLKSPCLSAEEASARASAIRELNEEQRLRHKIEQDLLEVGSALRDDDLLILREDSFSIPAQRRAVINICGTICVLALFAAAFFLGSTACFILTFVAAAALNRLNADSLDAVPIYREFLTGIRPGLEAVRAIESRLAEADPQSPRLRDIHARLRLATEHEELPIREIERRLRLLGAYKFGLVYVVFSWLTLYDLHILPRILGSLASNRSVFIDAFAALGELEVLVAVGAVPEEQAGWTWPEVSAGGGNITITEGLHPFLAFSEARPNSLELAAENGVLVITGSNMSGKSTFLKMCGLNQLLAQCGFPVRAAAMRTSPHRLHTDINVSDSLDDGRSYFAVEVGRIKDVIDDLDDTVPTFSLLDEMFRGTNTNEKVAAGIEVTRWIAGHGGKALVATHDAPFTALEKESDLGIRNFHFTEEIKDGKMAFDYRLRQGPARSSNAIRVLGLEGYPAELVRKALENSQQHD